MSKRIFLGILFAILGVLLTALAVFLWLNYMSPGTRGPSPRPASHSLKTVGTAQMDFRSMDRDGNGISDYWIHDVQGLYSVLGADKQAIKLIEVTIARADAFPFPPEKEGRFAQVPNSGSPRAGYFYAIIPLNSHGLPLDGAKEFGVSAYPANYGSGPTLTFILNQDRVIWKKDTGGKRILKWPTDPQQEGWKRMDQ